jgi:hypothetical protein
MCFDIIHFKLFAHRCCACLQILSFGTHASYFVEYYWQESDCLKFSILVVFNDWKCINVQELQNITPKSLRAFIKTFVWICNNCHVKGFSTFIINFLNFFLQSLNSSSQIIDLGQDKKISKKKF